MCEIVKNAFMALKTRSRPLENEPSKSTYPCLHLSKLRWQLASPGAASALQRYLYLEHTSKCLSTDCCGLSHSPLQDRELEILWSTRSFCINAVIHFTWLHYASFNLDSLLLHIMSSIWDILAIDLQAAKDTAQAVRKGGWASHLITTSIGLDWTTDL